MFSKLITINLKKIDDIIHLEPLGDLHVGHIGFNEYAYQTRINAIMNDDYRITMFMGDMIDAITYLDKRFQGESVAIPSLDNQRKKWQKLNQKLFDLHCMLLGSKNALLSKVGKVIGGMAGNHEYKTTDQSYIINQFFEPNSIDYLGSRCAIGLDVRYKGNTLKRWKILAAHGAGGGTNPLTALDQLAKNHWFDVYLMGHLHNKVLKSETVGEFKFAEGRFVLRDIILANTGTFCDTYTEGIDGYMDRKNKVTPAKIGTVTISFDAYHGKIHGHE